MIFIVDLIVRLVELVARSGVTTNSVFIWHEPKAPNELLRKSSSEE